MDGIASMDAAVVETVSRPSEAPPVQSTAKITFGQRLLFLSFILTAFILFAATVLLPMLRDYGELLGEERLLREQVTRLEEKKDQLAHLAANITDDQRTAEQLARIELGYQRPGETIMPVELSVQRSAVSGQPDWAIEQHALVPEHWPPWAHRAEAWAGQRGLIGPFLDRQLQPIWGL